MIGFLEVSAVVVPRRQVETAHQHLARVGRTGNEAFALWVGRPQGRTFAVTETVIPRQVGHFVGGGVCVTVDEKELHRLNVWLHENDLRLIAQLHSHPTDAYHSDTDDSFPIATTEGCLSLVVPDFASKPFALDRCATYRLRDGVWRELTAAEAKLLIHIED